LHLATLVSPDGAFGGPVRVALNQAAELRRRHHEVLLAAGWRGLGAVPESIDGVPAKLFRTTQLIPQFGLSGLISPALATWLWRNISEYDVVHIHAGRDLISVGSMAIARIARRPYLTQTHGMVQPDNRLRARAMDALLVRRLLRAAAVRFVLTQRESDGLAAVTGNSLDFDRLFNGVPVFPQPTRLYETEEVLFCARLHPRKRPVEFVQMAGELQHRGIVANYAMVGPDDGELAHVRRAIEDNELTDIVRYEGPVDYAGVMGRMHRATIYVLPSIDEPFPMSLLEALSLGLPCVCTDTCDIAAILREEQAALVTNGSVGEMADAVESIYADRELRKHLSSNARRTVAEIFSIESVGTQLEAIYQQIAASRLS
jgi:glycosyltransferase involved in cell wall biosynthesis